ncbi:MAG: hypothetical protein OXG11_06385, partial [Chloroflexi bacterium]|nr:hypothetical protein [Chloroflexota bacterium]
VRRSFNDFLHDSRNDAFDFLRYNLLLDDDPVDFLCYDLLDRDFLDDLNDLGFHAADQGSGPESGRARGRG